MSCCAVRCSPRNTSGTDPRPLDRRRRRRRMKLWVVHVHNVPFRLKCGPPSPPRCTLASPLSGKVQASHFGHCEQATQGIRRPSKDSGASGRRLGTPDSISNTTSLLAHRWQCRKARAVLSPPVQRSVRIPNASRRKTDSAIQQPAAERRAPTYRARRQSRQQLIDAARLVSSEGLPAGTYRRHLRPAGCHMAVSTRTCLQRRGIPASSGFRRDRSPQDRPVPDQADPVERIRAANRHYLETYRENAGILRVIQQVSTFDEDVRRTRVQRQDAFAHAIERRIREYQAESVADASIDPWLAANALGGWWHSSPIGCFHLMTHRFGLCRGAATTLWANALASGSLRRHGRLHASAEWPRGPSRRGNHKGS